MPEHYSSAIFDFFPCNSFECRYEFQNGFPPQRTFWPRAKNITIVVVVVLDQLDPWNVLPVKKIIQVFQ
jgi:hypothetical protein